ncbi:hypothetical protein GYMLUDRAFT_841790 [Collybiopsis luxurians FD-317 M1]|uniref:Uncharacterized protein n=1 Tax=Collybiopsis luxurians FD-317 M1 TaxID=944289 RepID=A0A0D0CJU9_9AGAR|nr:hypothetical protein GYMLUDRAFT_841790 [Collybiopsis luxurians FD-317 M1]
MLSMFSSFIVILFVLWFFLKRCDLFLSLSIAIVLPSYMSIATYYISTTYLLLSLFVLCLRTKISASLKVKMVICTCLLAYLFMYLHVLLCPCVLLFLYVCCRLDFSFFFWWVTWGFIFVMLFSVCRYRYS